MNSMNSTNVSLYSHGMLDSTTTTTTAPLRDLGSDMLDSFSVGYSNWHGYISLAICTIGIPLNIINIIVLTRKPMRTPINCILTSLAVSDMATMVSYVPFAFHFYCQFSATSMSSQKNSIRWMTFLLVYLNLSATTHTISIWLAVALAIFRHHHINSPARGSLTRMRRLIRARLVVCAVVCTSVIVMIPSYLSHRLEKKDFHDNTTGYIFESWELNSGQTKPIKLIAFILYSSLAKLVPCIMILIYGGLLFRTLSKTITTRRRLLEHGINISSQANINPSRTTIMLLIVIVLFLLTELPQAVLIMCCVFIDNFFENVYIPLGDVMDTLALINNSVNFVLYCTMSYEFRSTFVNLFCSLPVIHRRPPEYIASDIHNVEFHAESV